MNAKFAQKCNKEKLENIYWPFLCTSCLWTIRQLQIIIILISFNQKIHLREYLPWHVDLSESNFALHWICGISRFKFTRNKKKCSQRRPRIGVGVGADTNTWPYSNVADAVHYSSFVVHRSPFHCSLFAVPPNSNIKIGIFVSMHFLSFLPIT